MRHLEVTDNEIVVKHIQITVYDCEIYAEVFDSLIIDAPPLIPSRKLISRAPARPPYPSTLLKH